VGNAGTLNRCRWAECGQAFPLQIIYSKRHMGMDKPHFLSLAAETGFSFIFRACYLLIFKEAEHYSNINKLV
jgi:hypothetical protein